jgi:hypothetical protein
MKQQQIVRIPSLSKTLDTIQDTIELMGGEKGDGAKLALDAVRKAYGIPLAEKDQQK